MVHKVVTADCLDWLREAEENSVDMIATDPPYGIAFMGKSWDKALPNPEVWRECLRVLKPGGAALVMSGVRLDCLWRVCRDLEEAGFELAQTCLSWIYRCLSEDTEILTTSGWEQCGKSIENKSVICYNVDEGTFESHKPIRSFIYENEHPAYRIHSDKTDQIVTGNHRVLVERAGRMVFEEAWTLAAGMEVSIPILESVRSLPSCFSSDNTGSSEAEEELLAGMQEEAIAGQDAGLCEAAGRAGRQSASDMCGVRQEGLDRACVAQADCITSDLLQQVQGENARCSSCGAVEEIPFYEAAETLDGRRESASKRADDGRKEPRMEGRSNLPEAQRQLRKPIHQVCEMSGSVPANGTERWICDGASVACRSSIRQVPQQAGNSPSLEPQCGGQQDREPCALCEQQEPQTLRTSWETGTTLARAEEVEYSGKMWCVEVPTGAFVARRNGQIFITGNSGFPKGSDLSKMADKRAGAYPLASDLSGWFTRGKVKPAYELIIWARKPISEGSEFDNVVKHGTGGVNCGRCMIPFGEDGAWEKTIGYKASSYCHVTEDGGDNTRPWARERVAAGLPVSVGTPNPAGRFPANVLCSDGALGEGSKYFSLDQWQDALDLGTTGTSQGHECESGPSETCYAAALDENSKFCTDLKRKSLVLLHTPHTVEVPLARAFCEKVFGQSYWPHFSSSTLACNMFRTGQEQREDVLFHNLDKVLTSVDGLPQYARQMFPVPNEEGYVLHSTALGGSLVDCQLYHRLCDELLRWATEADQASQLLLGGVLELYHFPLCASDYQGHEGQHNWSASLVTLLQVLDALHSYYSTKYFDMQRIAEEQGMTSDGWVEAAEAGLLQIPKASRREKEAGLAPDKQPTFGNDTGDGLGRGISNTRQDLLHGNNHPTVKPVKLFAFLLSMFCPEGGTVLDPFCGSGTTGVAAKQQGFQFIGVEMNPEYAEIARARIGGMKQPCLI